MHDLELEIARTLGASCFLIHQYIKNNPNTTQREISMDTGLEVSTVNLQIKKLKETNVINALQRNKPTGGKMYTYKENEKESWKFH